MTDTDAYDVLSRAQETLERTEPTEAELAEQAERARRNRVERIMAPTPPAPPTPRTVYRQRDDALTPESRAAIRLAELDAKVGPWTDAERRERWAHWCVERSAEARRSPRAATENVSAEIAALSIAFAGLRREITDLRAEAAALRRLADSYGQSDDELDLPKLPSWRDWPATPQ